MQGLDGAGMFRVWGLGGLGFRVLGVSILDRVCKSVRIMGFVVSDAYGFVGSRVFELGILHLRA